MLELSGGSMVGAREMAVAHPISARAVALLQDTSFNNCRTWTSLTLTRRGKLLYTPFGFNDSCSIQYCATLPLLFHFSDDHIKNVRQPTRGLTFFSFHPLFCKLWFYGVLFPTGLNCTSIIPCYAWAFWFMNTCKIRFISNLNTKLHTNINFEILKVSIDFTSQIRK